MDKDIIWVGNLGEAAALTVLGHPVVDMRTNPFNKVRKQSQFGFAKVEALEDTPNKTGNLTLYWNGKLTVEPLAFYNAINNLRKARFDFEAAQNDSDENINNLKNYKYELRSKNI